MRHQGCSNGSTHPLHTAGYILCCSDPKSQHHCQRSSDAPSRTCPPAGGCTTLASSISTQCCPTPAAASCPPSPHVPPLTYSLPCPALPCRYSAVYRLANQVLILVISRAHDNIFTGVNLAASITKVLLNECKGPEITPDRLAKKYAMVRGRGQGQQWWCAACRRCRQWLDGQAGQQHKRRCRSRRTSRSMGM